METWKQELYENELYHHGILGMKWGVRRYQNKDGSYTQAGLKRLDRLKENYKEVHDAKKSNRANRKTMVEQGRKKDYQEAQKSLKSAEKDLKSRIRNAKKQVEINAKADRGKELYAKGRTIGESTVKNMFARGVAITAIGSVSSSLYSAGKYKSAVILGSIGAVSVVGSMAVQAKNDSDQRAYIHRGYTK